LASPFHSILFDESGTDAGSDGREAPEFFTDLNLDQVVASITAGFDEYNLKSFFHTPLRRVETIHFRHEVFQDLENRLLFGQIKSFARKMREMRGHLAQADKFRYQYQKKRRFLEAVDVYCDAVIGLSRDLERMDLRSRGFRAFREYLAAYTTSGGFASLLAETGRLKADLAGIRYRLHIKGNRITVGRFGSEPDYSAEVLQTFEKFRQEAAREYRFDFPSWPEMNHVEAAILDRVASQYPGIFSSLDRYCHLHRDYLDGAIGGFDREVQFYIAVLEHIDRFRQVGLPFCYPAVSGRSKEIHGTQAFDLGLAEHLVSRGESVVTNDFHLKGPERVIVVTGPNQGGKTTFARMIGQLHYLAVIGCPVPGKEAGLYLFDRLFTHFEREEDLRNLSGKLEDDLLRIHGILERATPDSLLIMNESFGSTTLGDALFLGKRIMERILGRDMLCVSVTFLDELASLGDAIVSMVGTVDPEDPARRTFRIVRRPADGLAYAMAIAEKYRLTYESVKERIAS